MKKLLLSLVALLSLGVLSANAETITLTPKEFGYSGSGYAMKEYTDNVSGLKFKMSGNMAKQDYLGLSKNSGNGNYIVVTENINNVKITKVEFKASTGSSKVTKVAVYRNSSAYNPTTTKVTSLSGTKVDEITISKTETSCSFDINDTYFGMYNSTNTGAVSITAFVVTYEKGDPDKQPAGLSFGETTEFTANLGEAFKAPRLTKATDAEVKYSSENVEVATVNESTGEVTLLSAGSTTITATAEANTQYNGGSASYSLTVIDPTAVTVFESALTTQDAFDALTLEGTDANTVWTFGGESYGLKGSIFGTSLSTADAYAILPAIDATGVTNLNLTFDCSANFFTNATNFTQDCSVCVRVEGGEWTKVDMTTTCTGSSWNFVPATASLATMTGKKFQIGFRYNNVSTVKGTWEIKNIVINGNEVAAPELPVLKINGEEVAGENVNANNGELTFGEVPEGISIYYHTESNNTNEPVEPEVAPAKVAPETMEVEGKSYKLYTEPVKLDGGNVAVSYFAYDDATGLKSEVKTINVSNTVGIEGIAAEDGAAEWFNLQGVRVAAPQHGIYVRVANGKAAKVVVE